MLTELFAGYCSFDVDVALWIVLTELFAGYCSFDVDVALWIVLTELFADYCSFVDCVDRTVRRLL